MFTPSSINVLSILLCSCMFGHSAQAKTLFYDSFDRLNALTGEKLDSLNPCSVAISFSPADSLNNPSYFTLQAEPAGVAPFQYKWTSFGNAETSADWLPSLQIWQADEYCVIIKDAPGCVAVDCYAFDPDSLYCPVWINSYQTDPSHLVLYVSTGSDSLTSIEWSTGANTSMVTVSQSGVYEVTAFNSLGCSATAQFELETCNQFTVWVEMADSLEGIAAKVYLYSMETTPPMIVDSAMTDVATGIAFFENLQTGVYTASAALLPGSPWVAQYEPETFAGQTLHWDDAQKDTINLFCPYAVEKPFLNILLLKKPQVLDVNDVYPNPVSDLLSIDLVFQPFFYRLLDVNGQILLEKNVPPQFSAYQLSLQSYNPGIYFLQILVNGQWQVIRIVKM